MHVLYIQKEHMYGTNVTVCTVGSLPPGLGSSPTTPSEPGSSSGSIIRFCAEAPPVRISTALIGSYSRRERQQHVDRQGLPRRVQVRRRQQRRLLPQRAGAAHVPLHGGRSQRRQDPHEPRAAAAHPSRRPGIPAGLLTQIMLSLLCHVGAIEGSLEPSNHAGGAGVTRNSASLKGTRLCPRYANSTRKKFAVTLTRLIRLRSPGGHI